MGKAKRRLKALSKPKSVEVNLCNPVSHHFPAFVVGNALVWQVRALLEIQETMEPEAFADLVAEFGSYKAGMAFGSSQIVHDALDEFGARYVVQPGQRAGKTLAICGAGPTLRDHAAEYCARVDDVWGCNSAATWLYEQGHKVTHGFTVDQTEHMAQEWASAPDMEYLVASTVHPDLMDVLVDAGRRFRYFHNFVGISEKPIEWEDKDGVKRGMSYEDWMYAALFPATFRSGSGLNSMTRAIDVAQFMGYEEIYVLGADCALQCDGPIPDRRDPKDPEYLRWLREHTVMHADGGHALSSDATPITLKGEIDGRAWLTKPDMAISAQWLVRLVQKVSSVHLIGDTLPNAILNAKTVKRHVRDRNGTLLTRTEITGVDAENMAWLPNFVDAEGNLANLPV